MPWVPPRVWTSSTVTVPQLQEVSDNLSFLKTSIDANGIPYSVGIVSTAVAYTISLGTDTDILCTGTFIVTLPTAVGRAGRYVNVKNVGTGVITMGTTSGQTIDGTSAALTQLFANDSLTFKSTGTNWILT